ncbi:MAG TPA: nicotinate-nucleotide--dimethylbenzimidazole phosphoribosyltransferase, partial [Candidatus Sumerlaeota bacterium]|nr:nicotinate-nucleotide--dimethylbenzimidazole phosphoribosyltransferase [Candidatus Sumerlaeota bacterium]
YLAHLSMLLQAAQARHREVTEPIEVLAAFGGFEVAVMVGVILMAASKRHLLVVDGVPACAALMVASRIAQPVTDYCVFCRSHGHRGLDQALNLFRASALLELGMQATDGTGATLAWPMLRSAAALLTAPIEREMILYLAQFPEMIERSAKELSVHNVPAYVLGLADLWNRYWTMAKSDPSFRVINPDNKALSEARMLLANSVRQTISNGLTLMGITSPQRMTREEEEES